MFKYSFAASFYSKTTFLKKIQLFLAYYWVEAQARGSFFPTTALRGGNDVDGAPIYVGQGYHNGDWVPAKVIPSRHVAYVCYGGKEIAVNNFKVLTLIIITHNAKYTKLHVNLS